MRFDWTREYLLGLPHVAETLQWEQLVYWVFDKAVGGKMFAMLDPEPGGRQVMSFQTQPARLPELLEIDGVRPAPYLARAGWVSLEQWSAMPERELFPLLQEAYSRVEERLPTRVQRLADLKPRDYKALVKQKRASVQAARR